MGVGAGGAGAAVAHDGAACLAALVPVIAATSRGRWGAGLTSWDFCNVFFILKYVVKHKSAKLL